MNESIIIQKKYENEFKPFYEKGNYFKALIALKENSGLKAKLSEEELNVMSQYCEGKEMAGLFAKLK